MPADTAVSLSRITQVAIPVRDLEEAKRFYADTLGMRHLFDAPPALSFFDCGGVRLMLSAVEEPEGTVEQSPDQQHPVLYYDVADIKKVHAKLKSAGASSIQEPHVITRMNGREIWLGFVSDGQGNMVGLMSEVAAG
ncbi:MAG: VOC family protein [Gemmatimonadaceae bacterium]